MISINTNLQSMLIQGNLGKSTKGLNDAIERMSTGSKLNHAKDNAANYSISKNYSSKLSSYTIAQENIAAGLDLVTTAQDTISLMQNHGARLHSLITQARNGTYGTSSIEAMTREAEAIVSEINRLQANTEYNDLSLMNGIIFPDWVTPLTESLTPQKSGFIADIETVTPDVIVDKSDNLANAISKATIIGIKDAKTLAKLADLVNEGTTCNGKTIILTEDIDLSAWCAANTKPDGTEGWNPIGNVSHSFEGIFDGQGHKVTGLYINRPDESYQGLFGYAEGEIRNVGVVNANVEGKRFVGGLVGEGQDILNCYATGNVIGEGIVGGLAGSSYTISKSYATGNVIGEGSVGGLAGDSGNISNSYATGNVTGNDCVGGLLGNGGNISYSYATGNVTGDMAVGGLLGNGGNISYSYATGRVSGTGDRIDALVGVHGGTVTNCWAPGEDERASSATIQVGIDGDSSSRIEITTGININLSSILSDLRSDSAYSTINNFLETLNRKETELGSVSNRLESALESTTTNINNLTSSLSTIKDADIAEVSSQYIKQQILQQAAATLLSTANQQPSIALQLI